MLFFVFKIKRKIYFFLLPVRKEEKYYVKKKIIKIKTETRNNINNQQREQSLNSRRDKEQQDIDNVTLTLPEIFFLSWTNSLGACARITVMYISYILNWLRGWFYEHDSYGQPFSVDLVYNYRRRFKVYQARGSFMSKGFLEP